MKKEGGLVKKVYQAFRKVLIKRHAVWLMLSLVFVFALIFSSNSAYAGCYGNYNCSFVSVTNCTSCQNCSLNSYGVYLKNYINYTDDTFETFDYMEANKEKMAVDFNIVNLSDFDENITLCYYGSRRTSSARANVTLNNTFTNINIPVPISTTPSAYTCLNISKSLLVEGINRIGFGCSYCSGSANRVYLSSDTNAPINNTSYYNNTNVWTLQNTKDYGIKLQYYLNNSVQYCAGLGGNNSCSIFTNQTACGLSNTCNWCSENWTAYYTTCSPNNNYTKYYIDTNNCGGTFGLPVDNGTKYYCDYCLPNWQDNLTLSPCNISDNRSKSYSDNNTCCAKTGLGSDCTLPMDNGTLVSCNYCNPSWYCGSFAECFDFWELCNYIHGENATNYGTCCAVTNLGSDCNFTGDLDQYKDPCGEMVTYFTTNAEYPYIDCNTTATFGLAITINGTKQDFEHLYFEFPTIPYTFNWTWSNATQDYSINLLFTTEGDYPYTIWSDYPYGVMENITGTLKVRCPCYVTLNGFILQPTNQTNPYKNIHAYVGLEPITQKMTGMTGSRNPYDKQLEDFITPLTFSNYQYRMFHAQYVNGQAVVKLWEKNVTYGVRLFDGEVTFKEGVYSKVNATKLYRTNIFLGSQKFECLAGTNEAFNYYFTTKELQPFTWLFNWIFLILIILTVVIAGALLFMYPPFAMSFGIGGVILLCIIRIVLWVTLG